VRGMIVIALIATLAILSGGIIATRINDGDGANAGDVGAVATATTGTGIEPTTSGTQGGAPSEQPGETSEGSTNGEQATDTGGAASTEVAPVNTGGEVQPPLLPANPPVRGAPIYDTQAVENYYSEWYQFENFVISWRPGAFPAERADEVAAQARKGLDDVNQRLGTNDNGRIEILLADQMYLKEDCHGCQGYAFSDRRQVFILQDGSMEVDEFQALLTHEIGHVIAGNHIALPHVATLFLAEGLSTWLMTPDLVAQGYIEPRQIAAWAWKVGKIPPIMDLRKAKFEGRTGARHEYDPAASFTEFMIATYGLPAYKSIYAGELPDDVIGKSYLDLEQEWHGWLAEWADNALPNGVTAETWWGASDVVKQGFDTLYDDETSVTQQQYATLATARVALNRGDVITALTLMEQSGLVVRTAN
jgi:hypothetical protein